MCVRAFKIVIDRERWFWEREKEREREKKREDTLNRVSLPKENHASFLEKIPLLFLKRATTFSFFTELAGGPTDPNLHRLLPFLFPPSVTKELSRKERRNAKYRGRSESGNHLTFWG